MHYDYEDLSEKQFEDLVVAICQFVLGAGTQPFASGKDGGRDARFTGTAELIPSKSEPWSGTVIVQAKHTNGYNGSFSDPDFYSADSKSSVLTKELPRVSRLRAAGQLDHYILFSNRRLTGNCESTLRTVIASTCRLPEASVMLCGVEQIELWLKRFPEAAAIADIDPMDCPLLVAPNELAEVVEHLAAHLKKSAADLTPPAPRVPYEAKNKINGMSEKYAKELRRRYLKDTRDIQAFLAEPENEAILRRYESAVEEFQLKVIAKRKDYQSFDDVFNYLVDLLVGRDPVLARNKNLTRTMMFYMYWNCDLGESDASPQ